MRGTSTGAHHTSSAQCRVNEIRNASRTFEGAKRRAATDKQRIGMGPRPPFFQVGYNRLTHFSG
jgi:hypothetical protein